MFGGMVPWSLSNRNADRYMDIPTLKRSAAAEAAAESGERGGAVGCCRVIRQPVRLSYKDPGVRKIFHSM